MRRTTWIALTLFGCQGSGSGSLPTTGATTPSTGTTFPTTGPTTGTPAGTPTTGDADGDGWLAPDDCDDSNPSVNPDAVEVCDNGQDDDCDGTPGDCSFSGDFSLATADVRLDGDADDLAGYRLATGADVTGDGLDDLLVTAFTADSQGKVWLVPSPFSSSRIADVAQVTARGTAADDDAGEAVHFVGDYTGDGVPDWVMGANGRGGVGAAYLIDGTATGDDTADALAHAVWTGDFSNDRLGTGVGHGDLNGDGTDDLVIGAPGYDGVDVDGGYVGIFFGPSVSGGSILGANASVVGDEPGAQVGGPIVGHTDLDGDGAHDLAVGVEGPSLTGSVAILLGPLSGATSLSAADARLLSETNQGEPEKGLAAGGDVDGDGVDDLLLGDPSHESGTDNASGIGYLITGVPSGDLDLFLADARLTGLTSGHAVGNAMSSAGDIDGDGYGDVLVAGFGADSVWLFYGPLSGTQPVSSADAHFSGSAAGQAGRDVVATDADGDGAIDVWIGALSADFAANEAGAVHLVYGYGW